MLQESVRAICAAAGWRIPPADESGAYAFSLEGGPDFTLSSPDGARLLAYTVLLPAPEAGREIDPDTLATVMSITAGKFAALRAVPALEPDNGNLALYRFASMKDEGPERLITFMETFLNEAAFWKAQLLAAAPFTDTMSMPGAYQS
ncbi:MAG: CesT family type III secretion system chaperone [Desulfovibrio sp.]|nr:CesT family type III secretion system chaperone [Desulfovibrio sp.]